MHRLTFHFYTSYGRFIPVNLWARQPQADKNMSNRLYRQAKYVGSYRSCAEIPSMGHEVAFAGRSNAGKSSAINTLCDQNRLAHTSKTPGRTQCLNLFELGNDKAIMDLPGYGFAKVNAKERQAWAHMIENYFYERSCLAGLVIVMDARHPLKETDWQMVEFADHKGIPIHVLLTKADKFKQQEAAAKLKFVRTQLPFASVQLFSSLKKRGVNDLANVLNEWLELSAS